MTRNESEAIRYARDEMGMKQPEVYGKQRDPKVRSCTAYWLKDGSKPKWTLGLIVTSGEVIDEFEPDMEAEPGKLTSGSPRLF